MLRVSGSLLKAWRTQAGWTQGDVARAVAVSRAAVASWESGARRVPVDRFAAVDLQLGADVALVDLLRSMGSAWPADPSAADRALSPQRNWGHVRDRSGPGWAWVRPASSDRVAGYFHTGCMAIPFEETTGADGLFIELPYVDARLSAWVTLSEPGWVDFGRGVIPRWLGQPRKTAAGLRDVELTKRFGRFGPLVVAELRDRDGGRPESLRNRLRALDSSGQWDRLEQLVQQGCWPEDRVPDTGLTDVRGSGSPDERRSMQVALRHARAMSQTDAAATATALLAAASEAPLRSVSRQQVRNYEEGRTSRARHLPALLDMVYGGFGTTCRESLRLTRVDSDTCEAAVPGWWLGPVSITASPVGPAAPPGEVGVHTSRRSWHVALPVAPTGPTTIQVLWWPIEAPLRLSVPAGWQLDVCLGATAGAIDGNTSWIPTSTAAMDVVVDATIQTALRLMGHSQADLDHALQRHSRSAGRRLTAIH